MWYYVNTAQSFAVEAEDENAAIKQVKEMLWEKICELYNEGTLHRLPLTDVTDAGIILT